MALSAAGACAVLVVTAGVLLYGAVRDLREYSISNSFVLLLAGLFFLHAVLSGRWVTLHENVAFALLMFAILLLCYSKGWLGGGDVKLLTVAMLWVGFACALPFSVFLLVFAALHTVAVKLKWVEGKQIEGRLKIAFAPSINASSGASFRDVWPRPTDIFACSAASCGGPRHAETPLARVRSGSGSVIISRGGANKPLSGIT